MRRLTVLVGILTVLALLGGCSEGEKEKLSSPLVGIDKSGPQIAGYQTLPTEIPPATVEILPPTRGTTRVQTTVDGATLTPSELIATLRAGDCLTEHKVLHIPAEVTPTEGDIIFSMDVTASMGGELNNVKANSVNIMNAIRGVIPDTRFGLVSSMDYLGDFAGCGYSNKYGSASDYPYALNQPLTMDIPAVSTAIQALSLGEGADWPECYGRVFFESYSDAGIVWRDGAKRIWLAWLDAVPHDCALDACIGGSNTSGPELGRDALPGTVDDLQILDVLDGMAAENINLIALFSGGPDTLALWECFAARTGGAAFLINRDGTVPGGTDIAEYVASLILIEAGHIDTVTLQVCTPGYEDWLTSVNPPYYADIDLDVAHDFEFDIEICVPQGTLDGEYCFDICAVGDGVTYATQHVCITVVSQIEVPVDVKPTSCPNPLNTKKKGKLPVAVLGTLDFDVSQIDPATIRLEGVAPIRWNYQDVATPFEPYTGKVDCLDCNRLHGDGFRDLTLKFDAQSVVTALGGVYDGECRVVTLTGNLKPEFGGIEIVGEDVFTIRKKDGGPHQYRARFGENWDDAEPGEIE